MESNLRPCIVTETIRHCEINEVCRIIENPEYVKHKALFHCWDEITYVSFGTKSTQFAMKVAIVEYEDGTLHQHQFDEIRFCDGKFHEYDFLFSELEVD